MNLTNNALYDRILALQHFGRKHFAELRARLDMLEARIGHTETRLVPEAAALEGIEERLAKVEASLPPPPLTLPIANNLVLAHLEYPNGKRYYSVVYHDGRDWRTQSGGPITPPFARGPARVLSWKPVELP